MFRKAPLILALFVFTTIYSFSQVTFIIDSLPDYTPGEDVIYVAGTFTGWNPGLPNYALAKNQFDKWEITLDSMAPGTQIEYKFTRGDWATVEKGPSGEEIDNRQFTYGNGDTVPVTIFNWADVGGGGTAAENVHIIDESFFMPQLNRSRRIWIYLPPDYETSAESYPVMYMHDGQNLFDESTSFLGEWEVDETLNELADEGVRVPIIVGVDNGGDHRIDEYSPWVHPAHGGGEGGLYMDFMVQTLKPYIDEHYRTLPDPQNTAIMGSSLGGLISHFGILGYQEIFSKAGIFSPSFWFSDTVWNYSASASITGNLRIYMMTGSMESQGAVANMIRMQDTLLSIGLDLDDVFAKVVPGGQHNEQLWRQEFGEAYLWLFRDWAGDEELNRVNSRYVVVPNPVSEGLYLDENLPEKINSVIILDISGKVLLEKRIVSSRVLQVGHLPPGLYIIQIQGENRFFQGKFIKTNP